MSTGEGGRIGTFEKPKLSWKRSGNDDLLNFLVEIEETVQQLSQIEEINEDAMMKQADTLVQMATDFVETLTEQKTEN
jgi:hypothetical protein